MLLPPTGSDSPPPTPRIPPPVPVADHEPDDEVEVDLADDADEVHGQGDDDTRDTLPEGVEYLGEFASVEDYLRSMLEPEISRGCAWLLDCLDWDTVIERFEADGARLFCEHGHVYRIGGA